MQKDGIIENLSLVEKEDIGLDTFVEKKKAGPACVAKRRMRGLGGVGKEDKRIDGRVG